jgi:hypothetical protein
MNWAGEMFVNYMDYSDDDDCTMFTIGQNAVMNETLEGLDGDLGIENIYGQKKMLLSLVPQMVINHQYAHKKHLLIIPEAHHQWFVKEREYF